MLHSQAATVPAWTMPAKLANCSGALVFRRKLHPVQSSLHIWNTPLANDIRSIHHFDHLPTSLPAASRAASLLLKKAWQLDFENLFGVLESCNGFNCENMTKYRGFLTLVTLCII